MNEKLNHTLPVTLEAVPLRVREIAMLRGLGYSFRSIADQYSVTPQAVSLLLSRHRRSVKSLRGAVELGTLSTRAVNALGRLGIRTRHQARQGDIVAMLQRERNCGRKTVDEIRRWVEKDPVAARGSYEESSAAA